jgi:hypothetical protein
MAAKTAITRKQTGRSKPGPKPHADGPYVIVAINLREKARDQLAREAAKHKMSISEYVRRTLTNVLARKR